MKNTLQITVVSVSCDYKACLNGTRLIYNSEFPEEVEQGWIHSTTNAKDSILGYDLCPKHASDIRASENLKVDLEPLTVHHDEKDSKR